MKIDLNNKGRKFEIDVKECKGIRRGIGLMFKFRRRARALLFNFKKRRNTALTSLFVFFSFLVVWLDDKNEIIEIRKIKPFTLIIKTKKSFSKILEVPINKRYYKITRLLCPKLTRD